MSWQDLLDEVPKFIDRTINDADGFTVNAEYWNELFNLLIVQGDHAEQLIRDLITQLDTIIISNPDAAAEIGIDSPNFIAANVKAALEELLIKIQANASTIVGVNDDLQAHKISADHDIRYYIKATVDSLVLNLQNQIDGNDADIISLQQQIDDLVAFIIPDDSVNWDKLETLTVKNRIIAVENKANQNEIDIQTNSDNISNNSNDIMRNANRVGDINTPKATTVINQQVTFNSINDDTEIFTLEVSTAVTGGAITIVKNTESAKPLQLYDGTAVEELEVGYHKIIEDGAVFRYAPSGGGSVKSVQSGTIAFNSGTISDISISAVDLTQSVVLINFRALGSSQFAKARYATAVLTSSTNLRLQRYDSDGSNYSEISWQVIEYENVKSLQTGIETGIGFPISNVAISSVDVNKSVAFITVRTGANVFNSYDVIARGLVTTSTNLELRGSEATPNSIVAWQVIEFN